MACGGNPAVSQFFLDSKRDLWLRVLSSHSALGCAEKGRHLWDSSLPPLRSEERIGGPWGPFSSNFQTTREPPHLSTSKSQAAWLKVLRDQQPPPVQHAHLCHHPGRPGGPRRSPPVPLPPVSPSGHGLPEHLSQNVQVPRHPCCGAGSVGNSSPPNKSRSWEKGQSLGQQRQKP